MRSMRWAIRYFPSTPKPRNISGRSFARASTPTGLRTTVNVIRGHYEIGRKVAEDFKANLRIQFDALLPRWNDVARPL